MVAGLNIVEISKFRLGSEIGKLVSGCTGFGERWVSVTVSRIVWMCSLRMGKSEFTKSVNDRNSYPGSHYFVFSANGLRRTFRIRL